MVNDTISDMLTRIRNAILVKSQTVDIINTSMSQKISEILEKEGLIESYQIISNQKINLKLKYIGNTEKSSITNLKRISKPGLRVYTNYKEIPNVLGGMGILILSTSQGLMTDRDARFRGIGGELICSIW